jgi:hypothetical protein
MNEALARLFDDSAAAPGALGCGVRLPDRTSRVRSFHPDCPPESLEKVLLHLTSAAALLAGHDLSGHRLVWTFTGGKLFTTTRPDGALFCLVTRAGADAAEFFDQLAAGFPATA